ncbi:DoxX family protein [Novosphingobium sp.]|uniref:DoxX family protein n=1 Tax=Novosphingobium sp. TaxID=1874826 RepID=UPI00286E641D|nr:DoxX family protein [Novosphingobium sp.]
MPSAVCRALIAVLCLLLATFFAFVGWNKAFASLADLARFGAWTVFLPEWAGRLVGLSEMGLAAGLLSIFVPRRRNIARWSALLLIANQAVAALVHLTHGETAALPQNGVLIALLAAVAIFTRPPVARGATP